MPVVELPFTDGDYDALVPQLAQNSAVNMYPHTIRTNGVSQTVMYPRNGFVYRNNGLSADGVYDCRGAVVIGSSLYETEMIGVIDTDVYRFDTGSSTDIGGINGTKRISMAHGGDYVAFCDGASGYTYEIDAMPTSNTVSSISDLDFTANGNPLFVTYMDGYFIWVTDESKFIISAINDPTSYNALDFSSAEYEPDGLTGCFTYQNQLFICGTSTIEVFTNTGNADFPFERTGQFYDIGILAPHTVTKLGDAVYFMGSDGNKKQAIFRLVGNSLSRISNEHIERQINDTSSYAGLAAFLNSYRAWAYSAAGHDFVGFDLGSAYDLTYKPTLVWDEVEQKWHERKLSSVGYCVSNVIYHDAKLYALMVGVSTNGGVLCEIEPDTYSDLEFGGSTFYPMSREVTMPPLVNNMQPFSVSEIELVVGGTGGDKLGVGPPAQNETVELWEAKDGAETFTSLGTREIQSGDPSGRLVWRRLGRANQYVTYKFTHTGAYNTPFLKVVANVQ